MTERTVQDIRADINAHHLENPSHGVMCACLDTYIREMRQLLIPHEGSFGGVVFRADNSIDDSATDMNHRWRYVIRTAMRFT